MKDVTIYWTADVAAQNKVYDQQSWTENGALFEYILFHIWQDVWELKAEKMKKKKRVLQEHKTYLIQFKVINAPMCEFLCWERER